jgi:phage terminase large subunit-like protein
MLQLPARFTAPLTEEFVTDGDRLIELMELCWVTPETDEPIKLDEWQKWLLRHILERYPADHEFYPGQLRYRQVLVSMGRQNGKTVIGGGLALESLLFQKGDVTSIASSYDQATIIYDRVKHVIDFHGWLAKRFKRTTETRGIAKADGTGKYKVSPAKEGALQGKPFVRVILDEGHLAKKGIWTAAGKGITAMADAMVVMITTAGDQTSETLIELYKSAAKAIENPASNERFGAFIWEAPTSAPVDSAAAIMTANPAIACGRIPIDRVMSDILTQPEHEVRRYTLNQFISGTAASWLPGELFKAATGKGITNMQGVVFAVDIARNWEYATIAAANSNGDIQETEIVASLVAPTEQQLFNELTRLYMEHSPRAIALDDRNLTTSLSKRLKLAGIPVWQLWTKEVIAACSAVYAMFATGTVKHNNDPLLVVQTQNGVTKYSGETWLISREKSNGEIDALMATIFALYVSSRALTPGIQVF